MDILNVETNISFWYLLLISKHKIIGESFYDNKSLTDTYCDSSHFQKIGQLICVVKFIYPEKATKFFEIFTLLLTGTI